MLGVFGSSRLPPFALLNLRKNLQGVRRSLGLAISVFCCGHTVTRVAANRQSDAPRSP